MSNHCAYPDAIVDAEQFTWYSVYQGPVGTWDACGRDVEEAQMLANSWSALVADGEGERAKAQIEYGLYAHAYESARKAARAAFRAVPSLRGDK